MLKKKTENINQVIKIKSLRKTGEKSYFGTCISSIEGKNIITADAVIRLIHNTKICKEMGKNGRQRVEKHFDLKRHVLKIQNCIDKTINWCNVMINDTIIKLVISILWMSIIFFSYIYLAIIKILPKIIEILGNGA